MKIKTLLSVTLAALSTVAVFSSCGNSSDEYHQFNIYPLRSEGFVEFADQSTDSTHIVSTDTWSLTSQADWLTTTTQGNKTAPFTIEVPQGYISSTPLYFTMQSNLTGQSRTALVQATSTGKNMGTMSILIKQLPYLNITTPSPKQASDGTYSWTLSGISSDGKFHTTDNSGKDISTTPYITFIVYTDNATLTSSAEWLNILAVENGSSNLYKAGEKSKVELYLTENTTGQERSATLTLTSAGVSTTITVTQNK